MVGHISVSVWFLVWTDIRKESQEFSKEKQISKAFFQTTLLFASRRAALGMLCLNFAFGKGGQEGLGLAVPMVTV